MSFQDPCSPAARRRFLKFPAANTLLYPLAADADNLIDLYAPVAVKNADHDEASSHTKCG